MADIQDLNTTDASNTGRWPENMAFSAVNDAGRADEGILARWFQDTNGSIAASGSSNAFAITSNRTISSLANNTVMAFTANHTITGAATLNLNGLGAKSIKRFNGNALATGDIVSGQPVGVIYKSSPDCWFMMSAAAALTGQSFADFDENGSPGNPVADAARVYAKDVGGVTFLAYRRSDGTEATLVPAASQSIMEAAASLDHMVLTGRQHFHPGHPKAGGNLNGTGTPAFASGDYGMGAVTDNGVGSYTLALDTAFANTNYWCAAWARANSAAEPSTVTAAAAATKTASSFQILVTRDDGAARDTSEIGITFWGDYA